MNLTRAAFIFLGHYISDLLLHNREIADNKFLSLPHLLINGDSCWGRYAYGVNDSWGGCIFSIISSSN